MGYTVALTGGIGSGKSTVAMLFSRLGITVVDADIIARQLVAPGTPALQRIVQHFGHHALQPDGSLHRRWLREQIFTQPAKKRWLDELLHPLIARQTQQQLAAVTSAYALWVVPLLLETRQQYKADRLLLVDIPPELQIQRTMLRDNVSRQQVENILANQASRHTRLALADDIIDNSHSQQAVQAQVNRLHHCYLKLAAQKESP